MAERDGTSLNQFLVSAIAARVGAEDLYTRLIERFERRFALLANPDVIIPGYEYITPKVEERNDLTVDAPEVNPKPKSRTARAKQPAQTIASER
jgi:hypothetical protein